MDLQRARYLVSGAGQAALASLSDSLASLDLNARGAELRRRFPPPEAAALSEQVSLRARAAERFGEEAVPGWLFTAEGLEMMTHPLVAARRARRLAGAGLPVVDLTCGLGGDAAAIAAEGVPTLALERDPATAMLAAHNLRGRALVVRADATHPPVDLASTAVVIDPSRRTGGARRFDPAAFSPGWDTCLRLAGQARFAALKAPPGIGDQHLPSAAEVEFVQLGRSLREATTWLGGDSRAGLRRAVLLPSGEEIDSSEPEAPAGIVPVGDFLLDPEGCVTRAGLVRHLAARVGGRLVDPHLAYIAVETPACTPFATPFRITGRVSFSVGRLKDHLRREGLRPDEIRRRAFPVEPDELRRLLGRLEGRPVTLICTTIAGERLVLTAERLRARQ